GAPPAGAPTDGWGALLRPPLDLHLGDLPRPPPRPARLGLRDRRHLGRRGDLRLLREPHAPPHGGERQPPPAPLLLPTAPLLRRLHARRGARRRPRHPLRLLGA